MGLGTANEAGTDTKTRMDGIKKALNTFFDFLQGIVVFMAMLVMIYLFVLSPQEISGNSMDPTFKNRELILTNKIEYKFKEPKRGEVVIFKSPKNKEVDYIKRIIGIPGDTVRLENSVFFVNGQKVVEPYISEDVFTSGGAFLHDGEETTVPEGKYFVVGDNRPHSSDSREFGPVPLEDFIGKAFLRYWPTTRAGMVVHANYGIN